MTNQAAPMDGYAVVPKLKELRDSMLFGDIWERTEISPRDRSMITIASLISLYRTEELKGHLGRALDNGVTPSEISEIITHLALYAGWPCGVNAGRVAKQVFDERGISY